MYFFTKNWSVGLESFTLPERTSSTISTRRSHFAGSVSKLIHIENSGVGNFDDDILVDAKQRSAIVPESESSLGCSPRRSFWRHHVAFVVCHHRYVKVD